MGKVWCWILGHRYQQTGTNILNGPILTCSRCLKRRGLR